MWKALELPKPSKKLSLEGSAASKKQKMFYETIIHKILRLILISCEMCAMGQV